MLFSGIGTGTLLVGSAALDVIFRGDVRWKNINELITRAIVNTSKATVSATLDHAGALIGRTAKVFCRDLFCALNF